MSAITSPQPEITFGEANGEVKPAESSQSDSSSSWLWRRLVGSPTVGAADSSSEPKGRRGEDGSCCCGSSEEQGAVAAPEERSQGGGRAASHSSASPRGGGFGAEFCGEGEMAAVKRRERQRLMGSDLIWLAELLHIMRPVLYVFMLRR